MTEHATFKPPTILLLIFLSLWLGAADQAKSDPWKAWLEEVRPIMTKAEISVVKSLQTEEDRRSFQRLFWQARDPDPRTPVNEFQAEYSRRRQYAEKNLEGVNSDRGRLYILLGKPTEKYDFSGSEVVVECELWVYQNTGLPGLPPLMDFIFYRRDNVGDLKLYYPGMNSPLEILSSSYAPGRVSKDQAQKIISRSFPELGRATLSIIPDEATPGMPSLGTGTTITQIFTLPEREVDRNYLKKFSAAQGVVDVTVSTKEIAGKTALALSADRGFLFLNYAIFPDVIHTVTSGQDPERAQISLNLRIEDLQGKTIHQQERPLDLRFDEKQKKVMLEGKKLVFRDFAPIIEGDFNVNLTFINKTTDEFFVHRARLSIGPGTVPVMAGYRVKEAGSDHFLPFSNGAFKVSLDPRSLFTAEDSIEGVISSALRPVVSLVSRDDPKYTIPIDAIEKIENGFIFRRPLRDVRPANYDLRVQVGGREVSSQVITVLSFGVEKPLDFERSEPASFSANYSYLIAQEYLNQGNVDKALENFRKLPQEFWNAVTLPTIARAFYLKKDYAKTIELLEKEAVVKTYAVLLMLGNSCLETKDLRKAAGYFEAVRKYGDTAANNRTLGAIYYSLGERDKARTYWERAEALGKKPVEEKPETIKESSDEKRR